MKFMYTHKMVNSLSKVKKKIKRSEKLRPQRYNQRSTFVDTCEDTEVRSVTYEENPSSIELGKVSQNNLRIICETIDNSYLDTFVSL